MADGGDAFGNPVIVFADDEGGVRHKLDKRDALGDISIEVWGDGDFIDTFFRELAIDLEGTERVDLVAEEVDAERIFAREAEDIDDGATDGKLTWLIDIIDALEMFGIEGVDEVLAVDVLTCLDMDELLLDIVGLCHFLGKSLGIGNDDERSLRVGVLLEVVDSSHGLGAQDLVGRVDLSVLDRALVARREERHAVVARDLAEVVIEVAGSVGIVEDEEIESADGILEWGEEGGARRASETLELDDVPFAVL